MSIARETVDGAFEEAAGEPVLGLADIPSIDLYMDQVLSLMGGIRADASAPLTKAMINNYSKDKLLTPVKGKKYSREQFIRLLLIYYMKPALPMQSIKKVLTALDGAENMAEIYERFLIVRGAGASALPTVEGTVLPDKSEYTEAEAALLIMALCSLSGQLEMTAAKLVEKCFPAPEKETKKK